MALPSDAGPCGPPAAGPLTARCFRSGSSSTRGPLSGSAAGELFRFLIPGKARGQGRGNVSGPVSRMGDGSREPRPHCGCSLAPRSGEEPLPGLRPITARKRHHVVRDAASTAAGERRKDGTPKTKSSARCLQGNVVKGRVLSRQRRDAPKEIKPAHATIYSRKYIFTGAAAETPRRQSSL